MQVHPLKIYRDEHSLTQQGLAKRLGVERTTVARWETGTRKIDPDLLRDISKKTGIPKRALRPDLARILEAAE